jgi:(2R)-3-sulfolactate dehydrogenase (NADP+)
MPTLTLDQIYKLSYEALRRCGASKLQADPTAESVRDAEADGIRNVGLGYLPIYLGHLRHGKVIGDAVPTIISQEGAVIQVDAANGFCHPAFLHALDPFVGLTNRMGIAVMSLQRSYSAGVVGWFNNHLARRGLVSLAFANAPTSVAPFGGKSPFFGTNPIGFGAPRANGEPIIVDMATSATAKVNIKKAAAEGREIPLGWAIDPEGNPTTDPKLGLKGGLAPLGGAKGFGLGLMVDILAAGLTGGNWAHEAPAFGVNIGGPPNVGQIFIAMAPDKLGGGSFLTRIEGMISDLLAIEGVRLPGSQRAAARASAERQGVEVPDELLEKIRVV